MRRVVLSKMFLQLLTSTFYYETQRCHSSQMEVDQKIIYVLFFQTFIVTLDKALGRCSSFPLCISVIMSICTLAG